MVKSNAFYGKEYDKYRDMVRELLAKGEEKAVRAILAQEATAFNYSHLQVCEDVSAFLQSKIGVFHRLSPKTKRAVAGVIIDNIPQIIKLIKESREKWESVKNDSTI